MTSLQGSKDRVWEIFQEHCWIPNSNMKEVVESRNKPIFVKGEEVYLEDIDGNRYIDAMGGIYSNVLGYNNKEVIKAIKEQAETLPFLYYGTGINEPHVNLSKTLCELAPGSLNVVSYGITGCDGSELAIKIAREYFWGKGEKNKNTIISLWGGYHGNSAGTLGLSGQEYWREAYFRNTTMDNVFLPSPDCYHCAYRLTYPSCNIICARELENLILNYGSYNIAAFIAEPIQGASITIPPDEYWPIISDICKKYNVLLILDEIVTGLGRTGKMFACEHWKFEPDIMTLSKGLASSYQPISAVLTPNYIFNQIKHLKSKFSHTCAIHPIACAAALANINEIINQDVVKNSEKMGRYIKQQLEDIVNNSPHVGKIRWKGGLYFGIELVREKSTKLRFSQSKINEMQSKIMKKGVISQIKGWNCDVLFITPPLIITKDEVDIIINVISEVLNEIDKS